MTRKEILEAARQCVCGDREEDYGSPENNFSTIANMWTDYLVAMPRVIVGDKLIEGDWDIVIGPADVAAMQALLKIARIASGNPKNDNWIDAAGYAACGGEIEAGYNTPAEATPDTQKDDDPVKTYSPVVVVLRGDDWTWLPQEFLPEIERISEGNSDLVVHPDCTVEVVKLLNGEESAGWWRNDKPPADLSGIWVEDDGDE